MSTFIVLVFILYEVLFINTCIDVAINAWGAKFANYPYLDIASCNKPLSRLLRRQCVEMKIKRWFTADIRKAKSNVSSDDPRQRETSFKAT